MKKILLKDYKKDMGIFIDINYNNENVIANAINIPYSQCTNYRKLQRIQK